MNRKAQIASVCTLVAILVIFSPYAPQIYAEQPSVPFRVEQVAWGTSTTSPISVESGDINTPLTTDIRNLSNETLRGVFGTLQLQSDGPFTDYITGGYAPTATGVPLQAGDIFNQTGDILSAGSFSLTFRININRTALPGYYPQDLMVEYLVKSDNDTWLQGVPKILAITILLPNRAPTIESFEPSAAAVTVNVGDALNFTSKCTDPDNDTITYEWKLDGTLVSTAATYNFESSMEDVGVHTLILTVSDGRLTSNQTWTITVATVPISLMSLSSSYITAGFENAVTISVQNNIWKGTVEFDLTVPSPIILRGNQTWTFTSIEPQSNASITPEIYAPTSAIGSTLNGILTINYADEHGQTYTETHSVGLIVQGYINLIVYDIVTSPTPVADASELTLTATVLNTGNVVASFANASIQPNPVLDLSRESITYMGDIEENSPVPFTVVAHVKANIQNGTYPIVVDLSFQDDQYRPHSLSITATIVVATGSQPETSADGISGILGFLSNGGWTILIVIGAGIALLILYMRRLSRSRSQSSSTG